MEKIWFVVTGTDAHGRLYAISKHDTESRAIQEATKKVASIGKNFRIEIARMPENVFIWRDGKELP